MRSLFLVLSDQLVYKNVDDMKNALMLRHCEGIRLNYVVYRKMTVDEAIVNKEAAGVPAAAGAERGVSSPFAADAADLISLKQLLDQPQLFDKLSDTDIRKSAGASFQTVLQQLP